MKSEIECLPCLLRQAVEMAAMTAQDPAVQRQLVIRSLEYLSSTELDRSPPEIAQGIAKVFFLETGIRDPYREIKCVHTELALKLVPEMNRRIDSSHDGFLTGLKLAIAGNIIDLGARESVSEADILNILDEAMSKPLLGCNPDSLSEAVMKAERILYLADNAGETVFDEAFIRQLPPGKVTVALRGAPAINDATMEDAFAAGLHEVAGLIENGSGAPATVLSDCSEEFIARFRNSDLIISKGQGNFESLSEEAGNIFFLFRVKCRVVEHHTGYPQGSMLVLRGNRMKA